MKSYSNFCNHRSATAATFRRVVGFDLSEDVFMLQWMKGYKIELQPPPRCCPDEDGWDVGLIVKYWSNQADNIELDTIELG